MLLALDGCARRPGARHKGGYKLSRQEVIDA
jgi:hypothetical protein